MFLILHIREAFRVLAASRDDGAPPGPASGGGRRCIDATDVVRILASMLIALACGGCSNATYSPKGRIHASSTRVGAARFIARCDITASFLPCVCSAGPPPEQRTRRPPIVPACLDFCIKTAQYLPNERLNSFLLRYAFFKK